jgi:hypothetical protein
VPESNLGSRILVRSSGIFKPSPKNSHLGNLLGLVRYKKKSGSNGSLFFCAQKSNQIPKRQPIEKSQTKT